MKTSKRVLSVLLVVLMLLTSAPLGGVTDWFSNRASAATNANAKAVVDNICGTVGYRPGVDNYNDCYAYVSAFCKKMYGSAPGGVSGYTLTRPGSFYLVGQAAGTGVTAASLSSVLSQAMPGDVVQMYWDYGTGHGQHTAIVYSADSSAFTILQDGASFSTIKKSTYNYSSNYTRWRGSGYGISLYRHSNYNNLFGSNDKTAPTGFADLGNDFYAYIGHPDLSKWVATVNNNVQCEKATAYDNQTWHFLRHGDGSYSILSYETGKAMDVSNYATDPGTNIQMMPYVDNGAQRFYIYIKDGYFFLRCSYADIWFDVNYDTFNVKLENKTGYPAQKFIIQKCDDNGNLPQNLGNDFYAYIGHPDLSKWVATVNDNVQCEKATAYDNQTWHFLRHGDGSYSILSYETGKAMDVSNYATDPGTNIQMMPYVDNGAQRFYIYIKDGYFFLKSSYADIWFDVNYDTFNVKLENKTGYPAQKFIIQKCDHNGSLPQNLGNDFYAYIEHPGLSKYVASMNNDVQCEKVTAHVNQIWHFLRHGDGSYSILSYETGYAMEVTNGSTDPGANLQIKPYVNNVAQRFYIYIKDGYYSLKSSYADIWFDVNYDTMSLKLESNTEFSPQKFKIVSGDLYFIQYYDSESPLHSLKQIKIKSQDIVLNDEIPNSTDKKFVCWNTKIDGSGTSYNPGDKYIENANLNLYAIWTTTHTHSYTSKITKSPTCTATGVKTYTCPCGDSYTETIAKTAHSYTSKTITSTYLKSGATCISPAVYYYKCASCSAKGTTTYTYGSALGHTGGTANCTDKAVCTRCKTSYGSVNASNHKSVVKDPAVIATCTDTGKTEGSHCEACGKVLVEQTTLSVLGHAESDWIFDGDGTKHTECTVCHAVLRTETTEECDHSEKRSEYIVTPTCTQPGKLVYICDLCDEQLGEEDVEPLDHSYDIETVTKATLSKNGAVVQTCFDCGAKKTVRTIYYPKTFAVAAQVYTGKALKPSVTVKDSAGKTISSANYTVTYANNVAIGTATAKVTFRGNYSGTKTLIFAIVPAQVSKPKATQTTSSVTLSWSKVAGSNMRYYVFSYNPGTKKYTCLGYTTGTSYTVKKLSSGTTYYFAVQAYNTTAKKWGKVSSVLTTATKPGTPTLKAVAGTRKATLSWNKQNGATGYLLYMATSKNGKYTKIATLKGNTKVSYTKMGLTKGRYYYFKVIAYKTVGSTNIYGAYSSVKYVKVK